MKVFDLKQLKPDSRIETDLCIIGSGPAGLTIANEFAGTGTRVLVLESGGLQDEPDTQSLYDIESTGAPRVMNQNILRNRILGGSSHTWSGRCAPFDENDFQQRAWIPFSGWPFGRAAIEPYLQRAAVYLGLAPGAYDETLWQRFKVSRPQPPIENHGLRPMFWQFSSSPKKPGQVVDFGRDWMHADAAHLEVLLHANVTHINLSADDTQFESVDISTLDGKRARVYAKDAVLACGGVENARLLLASKRVFSEGVGNKNDLVGRFLMDHVHGSLGYFDPSVATALRARFGHYWLDDAAGRHVYLHGFGLTAEAQEKDGLLNCHAYLENTGLAEDDPWAALYRLKDAARARRIPKAEVKIALGHAGELGKGFYRRGVQHRPQLPLVNRVELHVMLEQLPDPNSRVTLSKDKKDALGMPLASIHWEISDKERITARRMLELVTEEIKRLGLPAPQDVVALDTLSDWIARGTEKAHPSGTTRMAASAEEGVVDENSQVHGVKGLFVAGSSVFPTVGAANPTMMLVATSLRLADHLKQIAATGTVSTAIREQYANRVQASPNALRVGFIGASRRLLNMYLPILRQQPERYNVVGFTAFSEQGFHRFESETGIESFRTAEQLVAQAKPNLLILAVPDRLNEGVLTGLLDLKVPVLAETPVAWSAAGTQRLIEKASANKVLLGVAEQFPFFPIDQFRKQLIATGALGTIYAAHNDFHSYSYHAVAQLRNYLTGKAAQVRCTESSLLPSPIDGRREQWQNGSVRFDDGSLLLHNFATPDRGVPGSIRLFGTLGSVENDTVRLIDASSGQATAYEAVRVVTASGQLASISVELPGVGNVQWDNPFAAYAFSDEQIAVATNVEGMRRAIREGGTPLYTAQKFLPDIEVVQAFRYSASRDGANVALPLSERQQTAFQLVNVGYWKRKLLKR